MKPLLAVMALVLTLAMIWPWVNTGPRSPAQLDADRRSFAPAIEDGKASGQNPSSPRSGLVEPKISPIVHRNFDDYLEDLVSLGIELWKALERTADNREAKDIDTRIRTLYAELITRIPSVDEIALRYRSNLGTNADGIPEQIRRELLNRMVRDGLEERWQRGIALPDHAASDRLLAAILPVLSQDALIAADLGQAILVDHPYLGAAQEAQVMDLIELSAEEPFLIEIASSLLLTLWKNMAARGERMPDRLASLALLIKDDENPGRRLAALEYLLIEEGGHYRRLVVDLVLASKDAALAEQLAHSVANRLDAKTALQILTDLTGLVGRGLMTPLMILGSKDNQLLGEAYEQLLADGVEPQMRAELISGVGFAGTANSIELAKTALQYDPDPEVVSRALFVLSASGQIELAEQSLLRALDDPRIGGDPIRLGGIVHALHNLASQGAVNALHRLGLRIAAMPNLLPGDRLALEKILARSLPLRSKQPN